ncbi:MBL fold metallo-hydrolase [Phenylobacterium sp.]|uniref:MBL fold metallo-hydrolase n=1 Tax=Phenylobacterium sp. TaxID=1871053 RepID=UPI0025E1F8EE|nr:MBL fold metallo-hydrolase [Phenylobacterium sp.]
MSKLGLAVILITAIFSLGSAASAQESPRPEDGYFQIPTRVAKGVWVFVEPSFQVQPIGNVTLIEQSDGLVLVDAGGSPGAGRRIVEMIRALSAKPVKAVVITHWHGDHPQGLSEILKAWPAARTIATAPTQAHLRDPTTMNTPAASDPVADATFQKQVQGFAAYARQMAATATTRGNAAGWLATERLFNQYSLDMKGATTIAPAESFAERLDIADARTPIELHFFGRANTDGDAVVWLPTQKIVVAGDIIVAPFPFGFGSYPADWLTTLARVRALPFRTLIPGHGTPQHDRVYLDSVSWALRDIRSQMAPLASQGLTLEEARKRIDVSAQLRTFAGSDPWLRRWTNEYWLGPIVTSAYKEATGQPIVQSLKGG